MDIYCNRCSRLLARRQLINTVFVECLLRSQFATLKTGHGQQVKRNAERFPADFMFRLSAEETAGLNRSQFATGSQKYRDPRFPPYAFTEHGTIMAATVLNSPRAVEMSIFVVRAFVQLRELLAGHKALTKRLDELETRIERKLMTHDRDIADILDAIRQLMAPPPTSKKRPIGFVTGEK